MSDLRIGDLRAPFPPDCVHWRVGATNGDKTKGIALAYIDARDVMERLDEVVGPANWQCDYPHAGDKTVCRIGIRVDGEWVWKANGAGDTDIEGAKGALSDAFKRAAVLWGIGQYLYDMDSPWVEIKQKGRSYVIAPNELSKLHRMAGGKSAYSLKQDEPNGWANFLEDLSRCESVYSVNNLYRTVREKGWPQNWLDRAVEECKPVKERLAAIEQEQAEKNHAADNFLDDVSETFGADKADLKVSGFPGDPDFVSTVQAG